MATSTTKGSNTSNRGFASMDDDKQREIASKGGYSVKPEDRSFAKDHELAVEAGRKGGEVVSRDRQHMAAIGREGGMNSHGRRRSSTSTSDANGDGPMHHAARRGLAAALSLLVLGSAAGCYTYNIYELDGDGGAASSSSSSASSSARPADTSARPARRSPCCSSARPRTPAASGSAACR